MGSFESRRARAAGAAGRRRRGGRIMTAAARVAVGLVVVGSVVVQPSVRAVASDPSGDPVIAAAGDIACAPGSGVTSTTCHHAATSDLVTDPSVDAVIPLGDDQYENATLSDFRGAYDPTWGRVVTKTYPSIGNHEYVTSGAAGYFDYFGGANSAGAARPTGARNKGYYSFGLGTWHVVVLNSNCKAISPDGTNSGGCGTSSAQGQWLKADLAASTAKCTLAAWHHPRYSSHGNNKNLTTGFWTLLYNANADVILNGHAHTYERFRPQTKGAASDPARGLTEFVVGTGGHSLMKFGTIQPNSVVRNNTTFGVLRMTLHPTGYDFLFQPEAGGSFTDAGSGSCH
jgi:acid phosphatase type 7